jgi:hypothetical protein
MLPFEAQIRVSDATAEFDGRIADAHLFTVPLA